MTSDLPEWAATAVSVAALGLFLLAAWTDLAMREIPDCVCACLAVIGLAYRATLGLDALAMSAGMGLGLFAVLVPAHARDYLGGGDVKLLTAAVLGYSPAAAVRCPMASRLPAAAGGLCCRVWEVDPVSMCHRGCRRRTGSGAPKSS